MAELVRYGAAARLFPEPIFRVPRIWSNKELAKIGHLFSGEIVNVSGWQDQDKEGRFYKDYFPNASSYSITNFDADKRGLQGAPNEIFLDLEADLPNNLERRFDVAFNHTTLEHIYDFRKAVQNICAMSREAVILVVPFMQEHHSDYGDYWRFTPAAMYRLLHENGFSPAQITWNKGRGASVYIFAVGVRRPENWQDKFDFKVLSVGLPPDYAGRGAFGSGRGKALIRRLVSKIIR